MKIISFISLLILLTPLQLLAQDMVNNDTPDSIHSKSHWGFFYESFTINTDAAVREGISEDAFNWGVRYNRRFLKYLNASFSLAIHEVDDDDKFSVYTTDTYGNDQKKQTSGISGGNYSLEVGGIYPVKRFLFGLNVGNHIFDMSRIIDRCSNCPDEDIDIDSGGFYRIFAIYQFNHLFGLELSSTNFVSDADVSDFKSLSLNFSF